MERRIIWASWDRGLVVIGGVGWWLGKAGAAWDQYIWCVLCSVRYGGLDLALFSGWGSSLDGRRGFAGWACFFKVDWAAWDLVGSSGVVA